MIAEFNRTELLMYEVIETMPGKNAQLDTSRDKALEDAFATSDGPDDFFDDVLNYPLLIPYVITLYEREYPKHIERLKKISLLL